MKKRFFDFTYKCENDYKILEFIYVKKENKDWRNSVPDKLIFI